MTSSDRRGKAAATPSSARKYRLMFLPDALDEYRALDGSIRVHLKKLLAKRLDAPHTPGGELAGDLSGCYKIKLLRHGVRLVYQVEDGRLIVLVIAIDRREDGAAYKSAVSRLAQAAEAFSLAATVSRKGSGAQ